MSEPKEVHGKCRLVLFINDAPYYLRVVHTDGRVAENPAFELVKEDGTKYHVHADEFGVHCTCGDSVWRRDRVGQYCKHRKSLAAVGLIPPMETEDMPP